MSLAMRVYYNAVCGALGGLLAWAVSSLLIHFSTVSFSALLLRDALLGAVVGLSIGGTLGAVDGLQAHNWPQAIRGIRYGGQLGLIGGLVGLLAGEIVFSVAGGGVWPRALGWALLGAVVGASEGIATHAPQKRNYGIIGGILGGLVGGSTYERISDLLRLLTHNRDLSLTLGGAIGLVMLGACLGSLIALTVIVGRDAWLRILGGRLEGREVLIGKPQTTLGASDGCDVYLPGDQAIASQHAVLTRHNNGYALTVAQQATPITVNQQTITPGTTVGLRGGERIRIGTTPLVFRLDGVAEVEA